MATGKRPPFFDSGATLEYSTHALYHAALVCEHVTGQPYDQFAIEYLLRPLVIETWNFGRLDGDEHQGGNHPSHTIGFPARESARFDPLFLNRGQWDGRQIISASWVSQTSSVQVPLEVEDSQGT